MGDLKDAHKSYAKEPGASDQDFFRTHAPLFHDYWMAWPDDEREVEWATTEGDPMSPEPRAPVLPFDRRRRD